MYCQTCTLKTTPRYNTIFYYKLVFVIIISQSYSLIFSLSRLPNKKNELITSKASSTSIKSSPHRKCFLQIFPPFLSSYKVLTLYLPFKPSLNHIPPTRTKTSGLSFPEHSVTLSLEVPKRKRNETGGVRRSERPKVDAYP